MIAGMRVLCGASFPNLGHAIPTAALALEFQRAGNEVVMLTDADVHRKFYERLGLLCTNLTASTTTAPEALAMMLDVMRDFDPDVTIADWRRDLWLAQHVCAPRCRISILRSENFIGYERRSRFLPERQSPSSEYELAFLRLFGKAETTDPRLLYRTEVVVVPSVPEIDPLPPNWHENYPATTFVYTGPLSIDAFDSTAPGLDAWAAQERARGRRVALVTTGTAWGREFCISLLNAIDTLDFSCLLAILSTHETAILEQYRSPHLYVAQHIDLRYLLPHCDIAIHHSGLGTYQAALLAGRPSVTIPSYQWDREDIALRIEALGCGIHLHDGVYRGGLDTSLLNHAVERVLNDHAIAAATERMSRRLHAVSTEQGAPAVLRAIESNDLLRPRRDRRRRSRLQPTYSVPTHPVLHNRLHALRQRMSEITRQVRWS